MKVSRKWLQKYFDAELPSTEALSEALTFHAFEIEEAEGDILDVKVLPDRACYALSHRGIASELSAILKLPMKEDPLLAPLPSWNETEKLTITADSAYVIRHTGALVTGVSVGPSPAWLSDALAAVGQRSINNVVDVLNYVMLDIGQPSGAFDTGTMGNTDGAIHVDIRRAKEGEKITVLTGESYTLTPDIFAFTDAIGGSLLDIAGIKGGLSSGVTEATTSLFLSAGTYDPTLLRRASQKLRLFTDASARYQNRPSPELTAYGMRNILALLAEVAGGTCVGVVDFYPKKEEIPHVSISFNDISKKLGSAWSEQEMEDALVRLGCSVTNASGTLTATPPFVRGDIRIPEDLVEEVGRILGYENIPATPLSTLEDAPNNARFCGIERVKDVLVERGFVEVSTPSFAAEGEIELANPLDKTKPYLRFALSGNMKDVLDKAVLVAPRVVGPETSVRLFEIGNVFTKGGEKLSVALGYRPLIGKKQAVLEEAKDALRDLLRVEGILSDDVYEMVLEDSAVEGIGASYTPVEIVLQKFKPFSPYPFALRDVAVWSPLGTHESEITTILMREAGDLLARIDLFDRFEKDGRVSHAFRLVFESFEKTLSDAELGPVMERITAALNERPGFEVR